MFLSLSKFNYPIRILSVGFFIAEGALFSENAITKVITPTLPIKISNIINSLDTIFNEAVIPVDNPTVPIADITSNAISFKGWGSIAEIISVNVTEVSR
jgi:hypothetical protein